MLPSANPYASPKTDSIDPSQAGPSHQSNHRRLYFGWLGVFGLNLIVPLLSALTLTNASGQVGMLLAMVVILTIGLCICAIARELGFALVTGGVAVGLTQIAPILQIIAGVLGFSLARAMGLDDPAGEVNAGTVLAGFVITMVVGGLLVAVSLVAGLVIRRVMSPRRS